MEEGRVAERSERENGRKGKRKDVSGVRVKIRSKKRRVKYCGVEVVVVVEEIKVKESERRESEVKERRKREGGE